MLYYIIYYIILYFNSPRRINSKDFLQFIFFRLPHRPKPKDFLQLILLIFYFEYPLKTWGNPFLPHTVHFINQNQRIFYNSFNYVLLLFTSYIKIKGIFVINFIYILFWISYKNMRRCVFATYRTLRKPKARYFLQLVLLIFYLGCPLITWDNSLFATCFLIKSRVTWLYIYIYIYILCIYMV